MVKHSLILIPTNPEGSVEHFYHFLMSYLLPIDEYLSKEHSQSIRVRDCGPMNPWFDLFSSQTQIEVLPVQKVKEATNLQSMNSIELPSLEYPWWRRGYLAKTVRARFMWWQRSSLIQESRKRILLRHGFSIEPQGFQLTLINRVSSPDYYLTDAEIKTSGADRRSIPNFEELTDALSALSSVKVFEGENLAPLEQLQELSQTTILVGQHGAGLANMVWMKPGGVIIEILPDGMPSRASAYFRSLARSCGHHYFVVYQEGKHSPVDINLVLETVRPNIPT